MDKSGSMIAGEWHRDLSELGECSMGISHLDTQQSRSTEDVMDGDVRWSGVASWISLIEFVDDVFEQMLVGGKYYYSAKTD